jgi:hypothetical protein
VKDGSGPKAAPQTTDQSSRRNVTRFAEDGIDQLVEADRWLDSLDVVLLEALGGGSYSLADAAEYVLVGHGRIRRHLGAARVCEVAA